MVNGLVVQELVGLVGHKCDRNSSHLILVDSMINQTRRQKSARANVQNVNKTPWTCDRNIRQALEQSLMLQQTYLFRRRNFQMLLNTHSKAFSQQQLPLLVFPPENENLKKSWPAKIKHGWIPHRVCHFAKEDFKRDFQVYEYWSW